MKPLRIALALSFAVVLGSVAGCEQKVPEPDLPPGSGAPPVKVEEPEPPDLIKEDLVVGTGPEAKEGDLVKVHYSGRLRRNNVEFDSSKGQFPFEFTLGEGQVIKGWEMGVPGMKVGGKRKLTIPSRLAYGESGSPPKIPGNATLVFEIELVAIGGAKDGEADAADSGKAEKTGAAKATAGKAAAGAK